MAMALSINRRFVGGSREDLRQELRQQPGYVLAEKIWDKEAAIRLQLKEAFTASGLTYDELAQRCYVNSTVLKDFLENRFWTASSTVSLVVAIADALGLEIVITLDKKA